MIIYFTLCLDKDSGSGSEKSGKEEEPEKPEVKKEKNVKPTKENHDRKRKSPEAIHRKCCLML